jgi:hypothetical protein
MSIKATDFLVLIAAVSALAIAAPAGAASSSSSAMSGNAMSGSAMSAHPNPMVCAPSETQTSISMTNCTLADLKTEYSRSTYGGNKALMKAAIGNFGTKPPTAAFTLVFSMIGGESTG